jgi:hypothetical protein
MSPWITLPQDPVVAGESGHLNDHHKIYAAVLSLWQAAAQGDINAMAPPYGAVGDGVTDDTAAINNALLAADAQGGGTVHLPPGKFLVSSEIDVPPNTTLQGATRVTLPFDPSVVPPVSRIVAAAGWAPGAATGIVRFRSKTPGGWSQQNFYSGLRNLMIDGSLNASGNLNGVYMVGPVFDSHFEDVLVYKAPHNAVTAAAQAETGIGPTFPWHARWRRVTAYYSGFRGFSVVNFTDSVYEDCMAFGNVDNGWIFTNTGNSEVLACKAEWNGGSGFVVTGSGTGMAFTGCETDQNTSRGFYLNAVTDSDGGGISITGGKTHTDGHDGTSASVEITACTVPININGLNIQAGANSGSTYPVNGLKATGNTGPLVVNGCTLAGRTKGFSNGGTNASLTLAASTEYIGNAGSAVAVAFQQRYIKAADQTVTNSAAFVDDADVVTPSLPAGSVWEVEGLLAYDDSTAGDFKFQFASPAGATFVWNTMGAGTGAATSPVNMGSSIGSAGSVYALGGVGAGTQVPAVIRGILTIGATAGVFKLQWAQNAADAATLTVRAGSYVKLNRVS